MKTLNVAGWNDQQFIADDGIHVSPNLPILCHIKSQRWLGRRGININDLVYDDEFRCLLEQWMADHSTTEINLDDISKQLDVMEEELKAKQQELLEMMINLNTRGLT